MSRARPAAAAIVASLMLAGIIGMFWVQDLQYSRPTPVPDGWMPVAAGTQVRLPASIETLRAAHPTRPLLLHFVNPSCPCSRFNVDHVRDLVRTYGTAVTFVAVLAQGAPGAMLADFPALELDVPAVLDDGSLAAGVGAYSTPQAALIDTGGRLVFRGNYNTSRYCRDRQTEFARLAIEALLRGDTTGTLPASATQAYGCPLRGRQPRREGV